MKKLTLGATLIVKDETTVLESCLASMSGCFDDIFVAVTGGEVPETRRILKKHNCKVMDFKWVNDFAKARNAVLKMCTTDLFFFIDSDDLLVLLNGTTKQQFKENIIKAFTENESLGAIFADYKYDFDKHGNCIMTLERERAMRKGWYEWRGSLHENCISLFSVLNTRQDYFQIKHNSSPTRMAESSKRNFEIALSNYQTEMKEKRLRFLTVYDLARSISVLRITKVGENVVRGIEASIPYFEEALELANNDSNRAEILIKLAEICRRTNKFNEAMELDSKVIKMKPDWPDGLIGLGLDYYHTDRYKEALACFVNSLNLDIPAEILASDPTKYRVKVWDKMAYCLFYLEQPDKSLSYIKMVLKDNPDHVDMLALKKIVEEVIKKQNMTMHILEVKAELDKEKDPEKLKHLALCFPEWMSKEAFAIRLKNEYSPDHKNNRVIIFCGDSKHPWSPQSVARGIGGSEEAVIYISKELAELGWNVDVYCNCDYEGNYNGVMWRSVWSYTDTEKCDVFIAWREPSYIRNAPKGSKKYVWLHDIKFDSNWDPTLNKDIEKVFFLSKWHREQMKLFPEDKVFLTSNGIIKEHFTAFDEVEKVKNRCVYVSNPDRGLEHLLNIWPEIRKAIPTATLNVYYGFEVWDMMYSSNSEMMKKKDLMLKTMSDYRELGVTYFGKVGHLELAEAMTRAEYLLYPDYFFPEISCISVMKSMCAGCLPITSNLAALQETNKEGLRIEYEQDFLSEVIETIKGGVAEEKIDAMKKYGRGLTWKTVAKQWSELWKG